jgi:hypothetical protein
MLRDIRGADRERAFAESRARRERAEQRFLEQEEAVHGHDAATERFPEEFGFRAAARRARGADDPVHRPSADFGSSARRRFAFLSRGRSAPRSPVHRYDPDVDEQEPSPVSIMNALHPPLSSADGPAAGRALSSRTPAWIHRSRSGDVWAHGREAPPALPRAASTRTVGATEAATGMAAQAAAAAEVARLAAEQVREPRPCVY